MRVVSVFIALLLMALGGSAMARSHHHRGPQVPVDTGPTAIPAVYPDTPPTPDNILYLDLSTGGRVAIELYPKIAPQTVERIKTLTRQGFYNGLKFHRVIDGFMAQTGDPKGDGSGGSTLPNVKAEFNTLPFLRGTVGLARAEDRDSGNSQFFIMFMPRASLDENYTAFGRVLSGMQYVDAIERGEPPAVPDTIVQASMASDNKPMPDLAAALAAHKAAVARLNATPAPAPAPAEAPAN